MAEGRTRTERDWQTLGVVAFAAFVILGGLGVTFYTADGLEQREKAAWIDRAQADARRLTQFGSLALNQAKVAISVIAERVDGGKALPEEQLESRVMRAVHHADAITFEWVGFARQVSGAGDMPDFRVVQSYGKIDFLAESKTMDGMTRLNDVASAAMARDGDVLLSRSIVRPDGRIMTAMASRTRIDGVEGVIIALFDLDAFLESFMVTIAPDGLVLRLSETSDSGGTRPIYGPAVSAPDTIMTFVETVPHGLTTWYYSWDMLPVYAGGRDRSLGMLVRLGGGGLFVMMGILIAVLLQVNHRISSAVRRRTEELARARDQAEIANRSKSEFLANMSHELRTPLNSVIGFAEILESQVMGPESWERYRDYATDIRQSGRHLLSLINDILDLSKAEAGHLQLDEAFVSPESVIEAAVRLIHERARNSGLEIGIEVEDPAILLRCDERRVKQILLNLLSNAIKFTPRGGSIRVGATGTQTGGLILYVSDTGIGMRKEEIPLALTKFQQLDAPPGGDLTGTGLGLPLAENLARLHGASLEIDSERGRGTTVSIHFLSDRIGHASDVLHTPRRDKVGN